MTVSGREANGVRTVPPLGPHRRLTVPAQAERRLANGLTVIAIRRPTVPLVELRLWIPFGRAHVARAALLAQTLFAGTETASMVEIAAELQSVGGALVADVDPDRLLITGNGLVTGLDRILEILGDVLTGAAYPRAEVATERERLADQIQVAETQPAHLARVALLRRIFGRHPYAVQTPTIDQVRAVQPAQLRALHEERVRPDEAVLVLVGDLRPEQALDAAERALEGWASGGRNRPLPPIPDLTPKPLLIVDRPGSVQTALRIALPAVARTHPDHAALQLANLVFGGYFSSRWVENIREDKGYTYSPHSVIEHLAAGSRLVIAADVATEVTAPALVETMYELGRLASLPPQEEELEQARQYALGSLRLSMSTQAGLANLATTLAGAGLRLPFLAEYAAQLAAVTREEVAAAAATYLAPSRAVGILLGDGDRIASAVSAVTAVERADGTP